MTEINNRKVTFLAKYRTLLANDTVSQIDRRTDFPKGGIQGPAAWNIVRRERLAEERYAANVAKLRTMLDVTDEQLKLLSVKNLSNDRVGIEVRLKIDVVAEEEAKRLKMENLNV